jgi:hypothetical protein
MNKRTRPAFAAFAALAFSLSLASCSGGKDDPAPGGGPDVYVAGSESISGSGSRATLWKNGTAQRLSNKTSGASSVFVSGSNVYVAGTENDGDYGRATLGTNGAAQRLGDDSGSAVSVFASGNDVYVAGQGGSGLVPMIWKNGVAQRLSERNGWVDSVFVSGGDVYAAGIDTELTNSYPTSRVTRSYVWKNGVAEQFDESTRSTGLTGKYSLFVSGGDVYVAGYYGASSDARVVYLWKNGERREIGGADLYARSIYVSGSDVYVAGYESTSNGNRAVLWTNDTRRQLSGNASSANSVMVLGSDVYVAGAENSRAGFWRNGARQQFSGDGASGASAIFVAQPQ